ncbi:hypothetical protein C1645_841338 [Glomus cerebriforme]|uniref:Uncharacterized protein n=1 Tax=Glomus cerebriforme TaxID=658196 RepID=A0A397S5A9_9GLOM|nr:hypothetical protein C1645_841338 [Glomus cerebriforme]
MSYETKTRETPPYDQKIVLDNNTRRLMRKPPNLRPDCKSQTILSSQVSSDKKIKEKGIEKNVNNLYKDSSKKILSNLSKSSTFMKLLGIGFNPISLSTRQN